MRNLLCWVVFIFGIVCCCIALVHIFMGHASVPGAASGFSPTDDSEDRFYAALFLGFGAGLIWCSRDLKARETLYGALLLIFFVGGIARILSAIDVGMPVALFQWLGLSELTLPPLLWWWHKATAGQARL